MVIFIFPAVGKSRAAIGISNFVFPRELFPSDIPLPRLVIEPPPPPLILPRKLPLKSQIAAGGETCQVSSIFNFPASSGDRSCSSNFKAASV